MPKETPKPPGTRDILQRLMRQQAFMFDYATVQATHDPERAPRLSWSIGATARKLVERQAKRNGGYLDYEHSMLQIISLIPSTVDAMAVVNAEPGRYEYEGILQAKRSLVKFNHAIRWIVDSSPWLTRSRLHSSITEAAPLMIPTQKSKAFQEQLRASITGMQQEIFTEQALWSIDGVEVDEEVSIDDDLQGIDIRFSYNGRPFELDVKSREQRPGEHLPDNTTRFWTGLNGYELGDHFRANEEQLAIIRNRLMTVIDPASTSEDRAS